MRSCFVAMISRFRRPTTLALIGWALLSSEALHAQDTSPPTVTITPYGGSFTTSSVNVTIEWCDDQTLVGVTRTILLNGASVKNDFSYSVGSAGWCGAYATSTGTINLNIGNNTLVAEICDAEENCGGEGATFIRGTYAVSVTPDAENAYAPPSAGSSQSFSVRNTGTLPATLDLQAICSGSVTGCSAPGSIYNLAAGSQSSVSVSYTAGSVGTTGTVKLKATVNGRTENDSGWVNVASHYLTTNTGFTNFDNQSSALCAMSCFAVSHAASTVPYFSLDQPRSVTLVYNGDHAAARPFVFADVFLQSGATGFQEYWLEARDSAGVRITFVNGDTLIRYAPPSPAQKVRLAGQFDASAYPTGVFPLTLKVTAKYTSTTEVQTFNAKFLVFNERQSPVARGWTIAGLQRVHPRGDGALIADGSGGGVFFSSCGAACYTAPQGEFSALSSSGSGTGLTYVRRFPDSSRAEFNHSGRITRLIGRLQDTVSFEYDASWRLTKIYDAFRTNGSGVHLYTALSYSAYGLSSIQEPGLYNSQSGGRTTSVTVNDSLLVAWTDPDNLSTRFGYDGSKRLSAIVNRRGDTTHFKYDAITWKVDSIIGPSFALDPRVYGGGQTARLKTALRAWQAVGMARTSTASVPATPALTDTLRGVVTDAGGHATAFTVNRWGQARATTVLPGSSIARASIVFYSPTHGILPDSVRHHGGAVDRVTYNTNGLLVSQRLAGKAVVNFRYGAFAQLDSVWGTRTVGQRMYLGARGRVDSIRVAASTNVPAGYLTKFTYDGRHRVVSVEDPGGTTHKVQYRYDAFFGNRDSTHTPGNRYTRVRFDGYGRDSASQARSLPWRRTLFDVLNRPTKAFHDSQGDTVHYTYGDSLHLTEVKDAKGQQYRFVFNRAGFLEQRIDPVGKSDRYFHNAEALGTTWVNRRGDTVATAFDALHRPISVSAPGAEARTFTFDSVGRVAVGSNSVSVDSVFADTLTGWTEAAVTRFATDPSKRFRVFSRPDSAHRLDSLGISSIGTSVAFVARRYTWNDTTGRLSSIKLNGTTAASFGYNGELLRSSTALPNVTRSEGHTTIHEAYQAGFSTLAVDTLLWRSFQFDTVGRITAMHAPADNAINRIQYTYRYDGAGRLISVTDTTWVYQSTCEGNPDPDYGGRLCTLGTPTHQWTHAYGHDSVGNITSVSGFVDSGSATYNTGNRIATWPGYSFVHDSVGNLIQRTKISSGEITAFDWDALGHLRKVVVGSDTSYYDYNAFGHLVRKRKHGGAVKSHMLWATDQLVAELDGALSKRVAEYAYYPGVDSPLAVTTGDTLPIRTRYYQQDALGNVIGLINSDGTVDQFDEISEPWGFWGSITPTDSSRLGWKGLLYEGDRTKLYFVRARWFDPLTRRFISEDPVGVDAGINQYAFAGSEPVNGRDPSGLIFVECWMTDVGEFSCGYWEGSGPGEGIWTIITDYAWGVPLSADPRGSYAPGGASWLGGSHSGGILSTMFGAENPSSRGGGGLTGSQAQAVLLQTGRLVGAAQPVLEAWATLELALLNFGVGTARSAVTILGNYPQYLNLARATGAHAFTVGAAFGERLPQVTWALNAVYVRGRMLLGESFHVVTSGRVGPWLEREIQLLLSGGYRRMGSWYVRP